MANYSYLEDKVNNRKIQVESAKRDGSGKNIENNYAKQDGFYGGMGVGKALAAQSIISDREIEDSQVACSPITFGPTGDGAEISDGISQFDYLEGNSQKWNQVIPIQDLTAPDGITIVNNGDGSYTISGQKTQPAGSYIALGGINNCRNHKIFYQLTPVAITGLLLINASAGLGYTSTNLIYDVGNNRDSWGIYLVITSAFNSQQGVTIKPFMIDLTQVYGAGNEPTTVAEFKSKYPLDYYPYDAGSIISSKSYSIISKGKNQFEGLDTFIRVLPNTEYELSGITTGGYIQEYDANKNLIQTSTEITTTTDITLSANTYYIKIQATTYSNIMFYIAYETYNARYVEPAKQTIQLPNIELRSVGDVRDIAYSAGGGYRKVGYDSLYNLPQFNQLFKIDTDSSEEINQVVITYKTDGTITLNGTASANFNKTIFATTTGNDGYLYIQGCPSGGSDSTYALGSYYFGGSGNQRDYGDGGFSKYSAGVSKLVNIEIKAGTVCNNLVFRPQIFKLKPIFGADNQPNSLQECQNILFDHSKIYAYKSIVANENGSIKYNYLTADYTNYFYTLATPIEIPLSENPGWNSDILVNNYGTLEFTTNPTQLPQVKQPYLIKYSINLVEFTDSAYVRTGGDANKLALQSDMNEVKKDISDFKTGEQSVELAENLNSRMRLSENTPYLFRTTGGSLEVGSQCLENEIVGGSIVVNQWAQKFNAYTTNTHVINTIDANEPILTITIDTTAPVDNALSQMNIQSMISLPVGHKVLSIFRYNASKNFTKIRTSVAGFDNFFNKFNIPEGKSVFYGLSEMPATYGQLFSTGFTNPSELVEGDTLEVRLSVIDLTQMFGTQIANYIYSLEQANAGAGVAWVKQFLPKDYYEYTATPYFLNVKTSGKKVVGFNAYNHTAGTAKLLGGNQYQITGTYTSVSYTDINGNTETLTIDTDGKFTPTNDGTLTVSGGNATDTCVHIVWDGERDGEFEEYKEITYPTSSTELRGIIKLDSDNNPYYDGDRYGYDGTVDRRYGVDTVVNIPQWNQFFNYDNVYTGDGGASYGVEKKGITFTQGSDGKITISGTNDGSGTVSLVISYGSGFYVQSDKILISGFQNANTDNLQVNIGSDALTLTSNNPVGKSGVVYTTTSWGVGTRIRIIAKLNADFSTPVTITPQFINLTRIYGAGNEPTTVDEFKSLFNQLYYEYKASTANTNGAKKYGYLTADYTNYLYELATPTTETADTYTEKQLVDNWGTEEWVDSRDIPLLVGHNTEYLPDLKAKVEVAPESPEIDGYYVLKREDGINTYYGLSSYLADNNYAKKEEIATTNLGTITTATIVSNSFYRNNISVSGGISVGDIVFVQMSNGAVYPAINNNATQLVIFNGSDLSSLTITKAWKVR